MYNGVPASSARRNLACRFQKGGSGGEIDFKDIEKAALESQSFQSLAKLVAPKLAAQLAGQGEYLAQWLTGSAVEGKEQKEGGSKSLLGKAASVAGTALGVKPQKPPGEKSLVEAAADYVGINLTSITADTVTSWLGKAGKNDREDMRMVGAVVFRLLDYWQKMTGETFEGRDHQISGVYHLAQETFGGSMTKNVIKALVQAFLRIAGP